MEKLLKLASEMADQAEVYFADDSSDGIEFTDSKLEKTDTSMSSGIALRLIHNGRIGLAHTRNLLDREVLVQQALLSAKNGMEVDFSFPHTQKVVEVDSYVSGIENLSKQELIEVAKEKISYVRSRLDAQFNLGFSYGTVNLGIMNSAGTNLKQKHSSYTVFAQLVFPGTGAGVYTYHVGNGQKPLLNEELDEIIELFEISKTEVVPQTRPMPVIFAHTALHSFLSRFGAAYNPANIYHGISPLCGRIGEQILSPKISLRQNPFDPEMVFATGFDAEGTPTQKLSFFENGVFKTIPTDLNYASKLGLAPSGNAVRGSVIAMPAPEAINLSIDPGNKSLAEMIASIDEGIIAYSLMGGHSGNVLNGDYSVGVSTGFMIKNGKLTGRVKDCMLSGNVYDNFQRVEELENIAHNYGGGTLPAILLDGVSFAGK